MSARHPKLSISGDIIGGCPQIDCKARVIFFNACLFDRFFVVDYLSAVGSVDVYLDGSISLELALGLFDIPGHCSLPFDGPELSNNNYRRPFVVAVIVHNITSFACSEGGESGKNPLSLS